MKARIALILVLLAASAPANDAGGGAAGSGADVTLTDNGTSVILANGEVSATITKDTAKISAFTYRGLALTNSGGQVYYSMDGGAGYRQPSGCVFTVGTNTPEMVDIGMRQTWTTQSQPFDIEIHYVLRRGDTGIYTYALLDHPATYPAGGYGEWRMVWKTPADTFERLYVDDLRNRRMPDSHDHANASATGVAEILHMNTGVLAGQDEGKYCYNTNYHDTPVYGHATANGNIGVWLVFGSQEWFNDGPTKQDLAPAYNILHVHFGMNHYNGSSVAVAEGEAWKKLYGPFLLYCNHQPAGTDACWEDAKAQAEAERDAWPYDWLTGNPDYPLDRAAVTGTLDFNDPLKPALGAGGAWVGLAAPDPGGNWQFESKRYQHWVKAAADGSFTIPHVRPGTYSLFAFTDGATGEYQRSQPVTVAAGQSLDLGTLTWNIPRAGGWLAWEIGLPNRTASEFRHGDDYFTPFIWNRFAAEFPNPLNYDVSSSKPATDWNFAQPGYYSDGIWSGWPWKIRFKLPALPASGNARLTLAFAGSDHARMQVFVNSGSTQFGPHLYPANGGGNALIRQSVHAKYALHAIDIPVSELVAGDNVITLLQGRSTTASDHVMYDYVALEMPDLPGGNPADADGDGLPDAWELRHFLTLSETAGGDPDGDLIDNAAELAAGSDPNTAGSPDADGDLIPDLWERGFYPTILNAAPLDDTDGDGFNTWAEWKAGTDPTLAASLPVEGTDIIRTSDGGGFDGSLCEVNYSGAYDGGFFTTDGNSRNFCRQAAARHYLTVLKFDLSGVASPSIGTASLRLVLNGSSQGNQTRTLAAFTGDDSGITPALRYDAANPFIDDAYTAETDTDTDFAPGSVADLLTFTSSTGGGSVETIGSGSGELRQAVLAALSGDRTLTLILRGGDAQYLTQADEDPTVANRPALQLERVSDPFPDDDDDSLPDAWEAQHFGTLARTGDDDSDHDGTPEWAELALSLDPNDGSRSFRATGDSTPAGFTLTWPAAAGLKFEIHRSSSPAGAWDPIGGTTGEGSFTDPAPPAGRAFYRVVLMP